MTLISFDGAADYYDATRGYPAEVAQGIAGALYTAAQAHVKTKFLEVGVGTGRIAIPLAEIGCQYTGVDVAEKMLEQGINKLQQAGWHGNLAAWHDVCDSDMQATVPGQEFRRDGTEATVRLLVSDITNLPLSPHSFDIVVAVHIFHLVEQWQTALREVLRVLRPGGMLLHGWDTYSDESPTENIHMKWREIVAELGGKATRQGASNQKIEQWLLGQGLTTQETEVFSWTRMVRPRTAIELVAKRYWSSSWSIPDDIFAASVERLWAWAHAYYGNDLDQEVRQERRFVIARTQIPL